MAEEIPYYLDVVEVYLFKVYINWANIAKL